jgi:tripartite-type tricarboxylate transporter receptor subunit TctC
MIKSAVALGLGALALFGMQAGAQDSSNYPLRPLTIVAPFPAGGYHDFSG